ncbi:Sec-independent protein translocase subunit TatA [Nonomuraea pusilla]|uniref:Sec-independent protein translocase subunit TatA n=1 Tax=Nonomuraea pusilla TaxID=46177 RepID=UPI00332EE931
MSNLGAGELLIIALVLIMLFGSKKLPDAARSIGRSLRIFKAETTGLHHEDAAPESRRSTAPEQHVTGTYGRQETAGAAPAAASLEEQARLLEEQAARLRAQAARQTPQTPPNA